MTKDSTVKFYNERYQRQHYFQYREWLYKPFVKSMVKQAGLRPGDRVVDAGCGQGYFTAAFASLGLEAVGIDFSDDGVQSATKEYGATGARYEVGDVLELPYERSFDCVFARGLSLYNSNQFDTSVTKKLMSYLKPGGVLIFAYPVNYSPKHRAGNWVSHSLAAVKQHFSVVPGAKACFTLRAETIVLGPGAFAAPLSAFCAWISRTFGVGGEVVVFVKRPAEGRSWG